MAFPTTGLLDDFNRANVGPPLSSSWTTAGLNGNGGADGLKVISNQAAGNTTGAVLNEGYWNVGTFGPDAEVFVDVPTLPASSDQVRIYARITSPAIGTTNGYMLVFQAPSTWVLYSITNWSPTQLGATASSTLSAGDSIGLEIIGSTLTGYRKTGGTWSSVLSRSDSTWTGAGYIGLGIKNTLGRGDNFGGGTYIAPPIPPVVTTDLYIPLVTDFA